MEIILTKKQIDLIKKRLEENSIEEKELSGKDRKKEPINGWDFVDLSNERAELEEIIKNRCIQL